MDELSKIISSLNKTIHEIITALLSAGYIAGIILGIIGLILVIKEFSTFYKIHTIERWPILKQAGTIRNSYVEHTTNNHNYSLLFVSETYYNLYYRNRVSFSYQIAGKNYLSMNASYYEPWDENPMVARIEYDVFKLGSKVDIRVNPDDPSEAYILNKPYNSYTSLVVGSILAIIGIYVLYKV